MRVDRCLHSGSNELSKHHEGFQHDGKLRHPWLEQQGLANEEPLEFGHLLQDLIGGQLQAGFHLTGFFEDGENDPETPLSQFSPWMLATRAISPREA